MRSYISTKSSLESDFDFDLQNALVQFDATLWVMWQGQSASNM